MSGKEKNENHNIEEDTKTALISNQEYNCDEIFEAINDGIIITDNNYNCKKVNIASCEILGSTRENLIDKNFFEIVKIDNGNNVLKSNYKIKNCEIKLEEYTFENSKGERAILEIKIKIYSQGGFICIIKDKSKEYNLKKALDEAIEQDRRKTDFFSNLTHELRTPLNVMLGVVQLYDNLHKEKDNVSLVIKSKNYMHILKQNCFRLLRMVNNLLDINKIEAGYHKLNLKNDNIINVVEEITQSVVQYADTKGIQLIFDTEIEELIMAFDSDKIERIILNLLSNSLKFTPEDGTINVNMYNKKNNIIIAIKDDGIGIPKEKQKDIFNRFIQADKALNRQYGGTGIGLSLVKALVELHKGNIKLISEEDKGTEFVIEMPCEFITELPSEDKSLCNQSRVERVNIEFSDIYT
jgi:PAS domain S-box